MFWTTFFILINGFTVFYKWDVSKFLTACTCFFIRFLSLVLDRLGFPDINIPTYIVLYLGYKVYYKTSIPKLKDVDLFTNIPSMEETERPEIPPTTIWGKISNAIF